MKRLFGFLVPVSMAAAAFAQSTTPTLDVSGVTDMASSMQTGFTSLATSLGPVLIGVILVGVGMWLIPKAVGIIKQAFSSGKGR